MVPGNFGLGSDVLAAIAIDAPSRAARSAIANPIPRDPPVIKMRFPSSDIYLPFLDMNFMNASIASSDCSAIAKISNSAFMIAAIAS